MIILNQSERISIVAKEEEIQRGMNNYYAMFKNRLYSLRDFKCLNDPSTILYGYLREEANNLVPDALVEMDKIKKLFVPAPAPQSSGIGGKLEEMLCQVIAEQSVAEIVKHVRPQIEKEIIETFGVLPQKHEVITPTFTKEIIGTVHEEFETVLNLVNMDVPVFLSGPAGTGKNVICKQVAEALNLPFYFTNAVTQEYQIKGFIDANGNFHETQFYKAFTQGGLFFLDEMDGSIPETLIMLNAAIANRYFDFPTGKVEAHENFRIIAAGNTVGTGADIEYTGRFQLDASSLDRFALLYINYSPAIENAVTNGNKELCDFARDFRSACESASIRCLCTYRAMERIAKLETVFDLHRVMQMALVKGMGVDDLKIIKSKMKVQNKYTKAIACLI